MSDLLREIDQELRQDKARALMRRYGLQFLIGSVMIVVLVAVGSYLRERDIERRAKLTLELYNMVGDGPRPDAFEIKPMEVFIGHATGELKALGQFHLAGALTREGDKAGAHKLYQQLALSADLTPELQDLALLLDIMHRMDEEAPGPLLAELEPLTTGTWGYSARELVGLLMIRAGRLKDGQLTFQALMKETDLPVAMRRRLLQWQEIYGVPADAQAS